MTGQVIVFEDVRVGDRVRVAWRQNNIDYRAELTVAIASGHVLFPSERCGFGLGGISVGGKRTITLLDRPAPPSLLDRMTAAWHGIDSTYHGGAERMADALAIVRNDIKAIEMPTSKFVTEEFKDGWRAHRDRVRTHLTPKETT